MNILKGAGCTLLALDKGEIIYFVIYFVGVVIVAQKQVMQRF